MVFLFWICALSIIYPFVCYPLALFFLGLILAKNVHKADITPTVSLIIATYNEKRVIRQRLENALALDYPKDKLEIVIASEATDGTNEIVEEYISRGVILKAFPGREGKPSTLYRTVPHTRGEILVFSDANALCKADAIRKLVRSFHDPRIGCVSGRLEYVDPRPATGDTGEGLYWKHEMLLKNLESNLFSLLGANGSIYALRRNLYLPLSKERGDDFELPIQVALQGFGVVLEPEAISIEESAPSISQEFERKVRIISWVIESALILLWEAIKGKRWLLVFQLVSHKILRWLAPFFLFGLLLANLGSGFTLFYRMALLAQIILYCAGAAGCIGEKLGVRLWRVIRLFYYFCAINLASLLSWYNFVSRKRQKLWQPMRN